MKILVVDDHALTARATSFKPLEGVGRDVTYTTVFPDLAAFEGVDLISWDNDLGDGGEVRLHLREFLARDQVTFKALFQGPLHIAHSASDSAAMEICDVLSVVDAEAVPISILRYKPAIQKVQSLQRRLMEKKGKERTAR